MINFAIRNIKINQVNITYIYKKKHLVSKEKTTIFPFFYIK